ncbi:phage tail sheath C-terminal domain-containing protein [Teredinibacter sp. KSP-S5-2]|uniref:phage tail sheath C-terminal domain-containing protein n=1 Tax=Teredinibacter sp. KSP-S5-2 TaxID=3034506 RepID=UPI002934E8CF|nr:phage tail sheath C-terminal domain-containing protein [Teredinibacter sp. KSP-S5-2]WNO10553.1 phage tail sheath subtilisin-like domain-containing protein [Teredinibacter sp. KSP-S5-2]
MAFLHGVEVVEINNGPRPIRTVRSSVVGLIGTAPEADPERFPLNFPVLVAGRRSDMAGIGSTGTLPAALDDIFDQAGALIVVVRVSDGITQPSDGYGGAVDPSDTFDGEEYIPPPSEALNEVIGGVDNDTGQYLGVYAFLAAQSEVHVTPRVLIAPEFSHNAAVANEMLTVAERLRAVVIADGPNTNDIEAIHYREQFGSPRLYIVDPWVRVWNTAIGAEVIRPVSARVAGLIAKSDAEFGFWRSPSNQELRGILGPVRSIDFTLGDPNARANILNENEVATVIQETGYRLWGNRTCSDDQKWAFLSVRRTADMVNESILQGHLWAVDRTISKTYVEDVLEGVNAYLRSLRTRGAIINGQAWIDAEFNTPADIASGKVTFSFDFTPPPPAEHIVFRSEVVNGYLTEVIPLPAN